VGNSQGTLTDQHLYSTKKKHQPIPHGGQPFERAPLRPGKKKPSMGNGKKNIVIKTVRGKNPVQCGIAGGKEKTPTPRPHATHNLVWTIGRHWVESQLQRCRKMLELQTLTKINNQPPASQKKKGGETENTFKGETLKSTKSYLPPELRRKPWEKKRASTSPPPASPWRDMPAQRLETRKTGPSNNPYFRKKTGGGKNKTLGKRG